MSEVQRFFELYPDAPHVIDVGGRLFLAHADEAARLHAARTGKQVKVVTRPVVKQQRSKKQDESDGTE